jgi:8-amino-7-oxononanoate synthase
LAIIRCEHERQRRLHRLIARFRKRAQALPWTLLPSSTPIQPLVVGDNAATLELSNALWQRGLWVPAIRPPTVAAGTARLRVTLTAGHSEADVDVLTGALHELAHDLSLLAR